MLCEVSVLSTAFRPGGVDILLAGMRDQTFRNFEVILVDRRYERRREAVRDLAKYYGVELLHVPEHRRNGKWVVFASAWNTAIALARGRLVVFLVDWAYAPPGWIERHLEAIGTHRRYVVGSQQFTAIPPLRMKQEYDFGAVIHAWEESLVCVEESPVFRGDVLDEVDVFEAGRFDPGWIPRLLFEPVRHRDLRMNEYRRGSGPLAQDGWMLIKNDSVPREVLHAVGGIDDRLERGRGPIDIELQGRLRGAEVELWWEPGAMVYYFDPHWIDPALPFGSTLPVRVEGRWSWEDGLAYVERRRDEIQHGGSPTALSRFSLAELEERVLGWREHEERRVSWDVDDLGYWGREIWPDSP